MGKLESLAQSKFIGLNKDLSPERLPPEYFTELVNKKVNKRGTVENINGCSLIKDISVNVGNMGFFQTRGEDFVFIWETTNNKILVYTWENETLNAYNKWSSSNEIEVDSEDLVMEEKPWFVEHSNEFYFGNMSKGIFRFRPGHQNIMSGSAPLDIVVESEVEGDVKKTYSKWRLAYDYEYKGGRSPLSRWARVRLYNLKQQIKVTIDTPPDISKNRRIYAQYDSGTDDSPSWSDWYFLKETDDNDEITITLDEELVNRIDDGYKYSEDVIKGISPKAKMGIAHEGRICLSYLVESPSIMQFSKVGQPYYDSEYQFDLEEAITNHVSIGYFVVASTGNKIFGVRVASNEQKVLFNEGAYRDSMQLVGGYLYWLNEKGFRRWDGKSKEPETIPGLNTIDFSGLQKEQRYHLITSQQDFEEGSYSGGISSDYIPGALCLQPNLYLISGLQGIIEGQWSGIGDDDRFGTSGSGGEKHYSQIFRFKEKTITNKLHLWMKAWGTDGQDWAGGWIAEDDPEDPGKPNLSMDAQLTEFSGAVDGDESYDRIFELSTIVEFEADTDYHIIIPTAGYDGEDWQVYTREYAGVDTTENPLYPEGEWMQETGDGGTTWSNCVKDGHPIILRFAFEGYSDKIFLNPLHWLTTYGEESLDSDIYDYAQDIIPDINCTLQAIEIAVKNKDPSGLENPTITIDSDSDGEPSGTPLSTASDFTHPGQQIIRADLGGEEVSAETRIWVRVHKTSSAGYKYFQTDDKGNTIGKRSDDGGSTWVSTSDILWCKLYVSPVSKPSWASEGVWEGPEVDIGDDNNFQMLFANLSQPTDAGIKIELRGYDQSDSVWSEYQTLYDTTGANSVDNLPYDIETNLDTDIKKIQVKITLELSTADYTPIVDSILVTFKKNGDGGDKLYSGNVKGDYFLSNEDYDSDDSDEFTYVFTKDDGWHELSEPFFGYLPIGDDIVFGIGKNSNETYRNIYKLDDSSVNVWYSGDSSSVNIDTILKTGKMLWSNYPKYFRKAFLDLSANSDSNLMLDISSGNVELEVGNFTLNTHSEYFTIEGYSIPKHIYFSLPRKMKGRWLEIRIEDEGGDYILHGYEILYKSKLHQNISIPSSASLVVIKHVNTVTLTEAFNEAVHNGYLYVGTDIWGDLCARIAKYKIESNGNLTLISTNKVAQLPGTVFQIHVTDDYVYMGGNGLYIYDHDFSLVGNTAVTGSCSGGLVVSDDELHGWGCYGSTTKKLLYFDLSNKSSPGLATASEDYIFRQPLYHNGYIFVLDKTNGYLRVYDASDPDDVPYSEVGAVNLSETGDFYSLICDEARDLLYYSGVNYFGIIDVSDPTNPTVVVESSSLNIPRYWIGKKGRYIFGADQTNSKMIVGDTVDYRSIEAESYLAYSLGATTPAPYKTLQIDETRNLMFYTSRDTNVIEVFKIFGT